MRCATLLAVGLVCWGCAENGPLDERRPINLAIRTGTRISPNADWVLSDGRWALSGDRVYYVAVATGGGRLYVAATRAAGGEHEILDLGPATPALGPGGPLLHAVAPLPDGDVLCVAWTDTADMAERGILRWSGPDSVSWLPGVGGVWGIALSSDSRYLLYRSDGEVLRSYDLTSGASQRIGSGTPFAFAPDTPDLFYRTDAGTWAVASLVDGTHEPVPVTLSDAHESPIDAHWGPDGIRLLTKRVGAGGDATTYTVVDATSGERRESYESLFEGSSVAAQWLPAGRGMALWQAVVTDPCTLSSGCEPHAALYLIDLADGSDTWIAGVRGIFGSRLVYAPNGRRAVYNAEGVLYALALP